VAELGLKADRKEIAADRMMQSSLRQRDMPTFPVALQVTVLDAAGVAGRPQIWQCSAHADATIGALLSQWNGSRLGTASTLPTPVFHDGKRIVDLNGFLRQSVKQLFPTSRCRNGSVLVEVTCAHPIEKQSVGEKYALCSRRLNKVRFSVRYSEIENVLGDNRSTDMARIRRQMHAPYKDTNTK
jgi:hypothetical protein